MGLAGSQRTGQGASGSFNGGSGSSLPSAGSRAATAPLAASALQKASLSSQGTSLSILQFTSILPHLAQRNELALLLLHQRPARLRYIQHSVLWYDVRV